MKYLDTLIVIMPLAAAFLYGAASVGYLIKKDIPWSIVWGSYAMANVGLVILGRR